MALTLEEENVLKDLVAVQLKQIAINDINTTAFAAMKIKQDEIKVLDDKRNADIAALDK